MDVLSNRKTPIANRPHIYPWLVASGGRGYYQGDGAPSKNTNDGWTVE